MTKLSIVQLIFIVILSVEGLAMLIDTNIHRQAPRFHKAVTKVSRITMYGFIVFAALNIIVLICISFGGRPNL